MVYSDGDRRHVLRGPPRPLGASPRRAPHAAVALLPRHAGPCGHAERVRRGDADGQGPRDRRRGGPAGPRRRPRRVPLDRRASPGRRRMLSEEALILIAVVGACALLILGILELIWPSRPRHPVRRSPPSKGPAPTLAKPTAAAPVRVTPPVAANFTPPAPAKVTPPVEPLPATRMRRSKVSPHARPHAGQVEPVAAREPLPVRVPPAPVARPAPVTKAAALWSVVALAKQALGDDIGASMALESALRVAPADERMTYRQHIAALAQSAARTALARAGNQDTDDRIAELRGALAWTERGLGAVPSDERLSETRAIARAELWPTYEQSVHKLLQRQEFREARRLLREALDDPEIPAARVAPFEELLSGTFGGEIGQLTAQAIRSMQEARESEALASLRRAEELLETIPDEALPPKRREEVDQRLWWGYTRLGVRRLEAGDYEDAVDPLVRALRLPDVSPDRQSETRAALVRALEGVADLRALSIRQLNDAGDRDGAVLRTETLRELLQSCTELGLSAEELSAVFAQIRRLCEELGIEDHA